MTQQIQDRHRYPVLDSLRGLAALSVLITHLLQQIVAPGVLSHTPIRVLVDGRCFVIFFFVLSGFVLATAYWSQAGRLAFLPYVFRRFIRLYPPYIVAGGLAVLAFWLSGREVSSTMLGDYLLTLGTTQGTVINRPSWSLTYELHLSFIIPLLCILIARSGRLFVCAALVIFLTVEIAILKLGIGQFPYTVDVPLFAVIVTMRFAVCFAVGVTIAWLHQRRHGSLDLIARHPFAFLFLACLLMSILLDQTSTAGAAILIVLALRWRAMQSFMAFRRFVWLGRISYSLYLTHFIVIQFVAETLRGRIPPLADVAVAFVGAFVLADISNRLIEAPSIAFSRRIGEFGGANTPAPLPR